MSLTVYKIARKGLAHFRTTGMSLQELRDVVNLSVNHNPRIIGAAVHCNLVNAIPRLLLHPDTGIAICRGRHGLEIEEI